MSKELLLIGGGGHCKSVLHCFQRRDIAIAGIIEKRGGIIGKSILGVHVIGVDDDLPTFDISRYVALITLGSIKSNEIRKRLYEMVVGLGFEMVSLISDRAMMSDKVAIGNGTVVLDGVIINGGSTIGENCIINTGSVIEHDCQLGNHVHVATGVVMSGGVCIDELAFIGIGAVLKQGVKVGRGAVIGAGSVVLEDVPSNTVVAGVPAKNIKLQNEK